MDTLTSLCFFPLLVTVLGGVILLIVEYKSGFFTDQVRAGEVRQASVQLTNATLSVSKQIVRLSRAIIPPIVDFRDALLLKFVESSYRAGGNQNVNLGRTCLQVRNVRRPITHSYGRGNMVIVEFTLKNTGSAGLVEYWAEFPIGVLQPKGQRTTCETFVSNHKTIEMPAVRLKTIREEYLLPPNQIPFPTIPYTLKVRAKYL